VLLTAGVAATTVVTAAATRAMPVFERPVVDTIDAGDGFTAGFLTSWVATRIRIGQRPPDAFMVACPVLVSPAHDHRKERCSVASTYGRQSVARDTDRTASVRSGATGERP
jgi:sugar/nucleoside kinase (ribokinase family)